LVGVVSASDLLAFASTMSGVPTTRDFADPLDVDRAALERIDDHDDEEGGSAFFTDLWDDAGADVVARVENVDSPEWNALEEHDVSEAMTRLPVCTLPPNADVRQAAERMTERRIHRVLVTDGDRLVGIVSSLDFVKAVAERKLREGSLTKVQGLSESSSRS
jgi:CBS domain-containing protein